MEAQMNENCTISLSSLKNLNGLMYVCDMILQM